MDLQQRISLCPPPTPQAQAAGTNAGAAELGGAAAPPSELEILQQKLDDLVAAECPLTGDSMIETINQPFFEDGEEANWQL